MKKLNKNNVVTGVLAVLMTVAGVVGCSSKESKVDEAAVTPSGTTVAQNSSADSNLGAGSSGRAH